MDSVDKPARRYGWSERLLLLFIHLLVWGYVARIFVRPQNGWSFYFAAISMAIFMLALIRTRGWFRVFSFVFLLSGLFVIGQNDVPVTDVWQFFGSTTSILTLLILAPYFSIPIALGAYHRSALLIVRGRVRQPHSTYFILSSFTYLLATLMNVAAVAHTTFHNLTRSYSKAIADKIHFAAFTRGVVLAGIWSPGGATLGAALARVPAEPGTVIAVGFGFSLFMLMFGYVVDEGKGPALCSCAFVADTDGDAAGSRIRCPLAACRYFLWHHRYIRRRGHCPARRVGHAGHRRRHFAHFVPFIGVVAGIEETKTTVARTANKKH